MPFPPISPSAPLTENPVFLRAPVALLAAGAYETSPEFSVAGYTYITLYFQYIRGAAGGAFTFRIECSPFAIDQTVFEDWYQSALYEAGNLAAGSDVNSLIQREEIEYASTGAAIETFVYGPVAIQGNVERMRISVAESGVTATPGAAGLIAMLYSLG